MCLLLLFNYTSAGKGLGYNKVWIRGYSFPIRTKELSLISWIKYTILFYFYSTYSSAWPWSCSHQRINLLDNSPLSARVHRPNIVCPAMYYVIVAWCILKYSHIGHNPITSIASKVATQFNWILVAITRDVLHSLLSGDFNLHLSSINSFFFTWW